MATTTRRPKSSELIILESHIQVAQDLLNSLDAQIRAFSVSGKRFKTIIQDIDELDKVYGLHLKYATEYARLTGLIHYCQETQKQSKKLREGSVVSPIIDLVANEANLSRAMANLMQDFGMDLPPSVMEMKFDDDQKEEAKTTPPKKKRKSKEAEE